jgi:hypothetical protein
MEYDAPVAQQVTSRNIGMSQDMTGFGLVVPMAEGTTISYSVPSSTDTDPRDPERAFRKYEELMDILDRLQIGSSFTHETRDYNHTIKRVEHGFLTIRMPKRPSDTYVNLTTCNREQLNHSITGWVQEEISRELRGNSEDEIQ